MRWSMMAVRCKRPFEGYGWDVCQSDAYVCRSQLWKIEYDALPTIKYTGLEPVDMTGSTITDLYFQSSGRTCECHEVG